MEPAEATAAVTPVRSLFESIFSPEEEIKLLEEYKDFVEKHGHNVKSKWVEFYKICSLNHKYKHTQISKKVGGLEKKFEKQKTSCCAPPSDPHKLRLFRLSKSVWGDDNNPPQPRPQPKKRSRAAAEKKQWTALEVEELELYYKSLILLRKQCRMVSQRIDFNTHQSSPPTEKKQSEEKEIPKPIFDSDNEAALVNDTTKEDLISPEYCGQASDDKLEDEKEVNDQEIVAVVEDGGLSKEDTSVVEMEDVDLSMACVEERTENQLLDETNPDLMENALIPQDLTSAKVEDDGTKKSSSEKKKKKKMKMKKKKTKDIEGTSPQVETPRFSLVIEVLEEGEPNGALACKGGKVKVHYFGKLKESEEVFESSTAIINLGDEELIEGLRTGIEGMCVGEKRRLIIPPYLGYGEEGCGGSDPPIPPNSWLVYEVKLIATAS